MKPFSEACERNREPILTELKRLFRGRSLVLEIGSGTGQHAAYFAPELPHLVWQPSDLAVNLPGIREWVAEARSSNLRAPMALNVDDAWPAVDADAAYSANTCHIMSWRQVERLFAGLGRMSRLETFVLYGPFKYGGRHTSDSNERFDAMLRAREPASGVRDFEAVCTLAQSSGLRTAEDIAMPANNRLLVFARH
jgi:SAM-dependent methyltransferase